MKKVFLSLAALAFVATGSLTMTSCGGNDDGTPVVPNPNPNPNPDPNPNPGTQADNTVRFNGVDSPLDFSYYELVTRNYETSTGETVENVNVYNYPDGGYANGFYVNVGYNMTADNVDTYHYALILVPNESIVVENNVITNFGTPVFPHQAEDIYWAQAYVQIDGTEYTSVQGNVGTGSVVVNTLVMQEDPNDEVFAIGTSNFESQFSIDGSNFNFKFNGDTFVDFYNVSTSGKGVSSAKLNMAKNIKNLEVNAKTNISLKK